MFAAKNAFLTTVAALPVAYDTAGSGTSTTNGFTTTVSASTTWSHTIAGSANAIIAMVHAETAIANTSITTTATCGGVTMNQLINYEYYSGSGIFYWFAVFGLLNPPTGAQTIQASFTQVGTHNIFASVDSFSYENVTSFGAAVSNPAANSNTSGTTPTITAASAPGQMVWNALGSSATSAGATAYNHTQRYNVAATNNNNVTVVGDAPGAASLTFSCTTPNAFWGAVAVPLV